MSVYRNKNFGQYSQLLIRVFILFLTSNSAFTIKQSVIIDTDAGADDAMAILMLLSRSQLINVSAITCVRGNTGVYNVSRNVLKTLDVANRLDIPVYVGSATGLVYSQKLEEYFGYDGFGDFEYLNPPSPKLLRKEHPAVILAERVEQQPGAITIICIGPLTNIALASLINRNFFKQVKAIFILGGSYKGEGNIAPGIEFNMHADAEAAASFFTRLPNGTPTVLLPYETLMENSFTLDWRLNTFGKIPNNKIAFLNLAERKTLNEQQWTAFDPALTAVVLNPDIITSTKRGKPVVSTTTNIGYMNITFEQGSVTVVTSLNRVELKNTLIETLS